MTSSNVIKIDSEKIEIDVLDKAAEIVNNGGVIVYPTDTFYALGTNPTMAEGIERVYQIKGRERRKPILCVISELEAVMRLAAEIPPGFGALTEKFWPGPLTIIFKASPAAQGALLGSENTIALRSLVFGKTEIDLSAFEQLVDPSQTRTIGE
ncbi:Sua5/YciO/YrdC/YwlC family protein, partial [Acidobacteriota bacterium]